MATFSSYDIIKKMVDNDGHYSTDPRPLAIYEYQSHEGAVNWCVIYVPADELALFDSPYVVDPQLLWSQEEGKVREPSPRKSGVL